MKSDVELADQLTVAGWKILFAMKDENNSENTQKKNEWSKHFTQNH